jgi:hypothetical protein
VALDTGLPKALASRLQGDDEESLKADAGSIAELLKREDGGGLAGPAAPVTQELDMNDRLRIAAGREPAGK